MLEWGSELVCQGNLYERTLGRILPGDRLLALLFCFALNSMVYWGGQALAQGRPLTDMTTALDQSIPLAPGWSVIYVAAFPMWVLCYVVMARGWDWYRIMTAEVLAKLLCGVCFLVLPTTNVRPELAGDGFGVWLLALIYRLDQPLNLFPSIHCMESWLCFAGLRGRRNIPQWRKAMLLAMAVLVCCSTVLTRQHVLVDVVAGILLAEGMVQLSKRLRWGRRLRGCFTALGRQLHTVK